MKLAGWEVARQLSLYFSLLRRKHSLVPQVSLRDHAGAVKGCPSTFFQLGLLISSHQDKAALKKGEL